MKPSTSAPTDAVEVEAAGTLPREFSQVLPEMSAKHFGQFLTRSLLLDTDNIDAVAKDRRDLIQAARECLELSPNSVGEVKTEGLTLRDIFTNCLDKS